MAEGNAEHWEGMTGLWTAGQKAVSVRFPPENFYGFPRISKEPLCLEHNAVKGGKVPLCRRGAYP